MTEQRDQSQELEERIQKRLKQSENPMSIVLAFRSRECLAVIPTLYSFDKSVSRLRWDAGLRIPMEEATDLLV